MEAATLSKALTVLLLTGALLYLLPLRPWHLKRLYLGRVPSVDGLFVIALALGLAALHAAAPFEQVALRIVEYTSLPETLLEIDLQIQFLEQWPEQVWNDLTIRLGWNEPPPLLSPGAPEPGWVTEAVLPGVVGVVEVMLRGFVYWGSLILMAVCLAIRLAVALIRSIRNRSASQAQAAIEGQLAKLEEKIATLEQRLENPNRSISAKSTQV